MNKQTKTFISDSKKLVIFVVYNRHKETFFGFLMQSRVENEFSELWICGDIMYCCGANGMAINLPAAKSIVADREKLAAGKKYPLVIDIRTLLYMDREAREYFASAAATRSLNACALLISSPTSRILADFFVKFHKPAIPTRAFNNLESAEKWLKSFVETSELV